MPAVSCCHIDTVTRMYRCLMNDYTWLFDTGNWPTRVNYLQTLPVNIRKGVTYWFLCGYHYSNHVNHNLLTLSRLKNCWGVIPGQDGLSTCRSVGDRLLDCETKEGPFCANINPLLARLINSFKGPMACYFMDAYVLVGHQHLKRFKKFSLGAELQALRASPTMSFPQMRRF